MKILICQSCVYTLWLLKICLFSFTTHCASFTLPRLISRLKLQSVAATNMVHTPQPLLPLEKPTNTENEYEQFFLPNGVAVTLTSIPNSEKSAAALAVHVGAQDDFPSLPGLAHFTEHALFLGSLTYSDENAFKSFLSKHGGSSNGGTSMEFTSYQFQVNKASFSEALDIWSHFFIDPLFADDAISREVMAVDAEDSKNRVLDNRRMLQVMKACIVDDAPYKKFSTGNVHTLAAGDAEGNGAALANQMKNFYNLYYNPSSMTLSLVGPQSIQELRQLAIDKFAGIQDKDAPHGLELGRNITFPYSNQDYTGVYPLKPELTGHILRILPTKDIRDLSILIPLPPTRELHLAPPTRLLAVLISHKGERSLFSFLQDKGWATSVSGGERIDAAEFCMFEISVALTVEGLLHSEDVIEAIFAHLHILESASDEELLRVWLEVKAMGEIDFRYQEKSTAYELAPYLAKQMLDLPMHRILSSGWLLHELDVSLLRKQFLSRLLPQRSLVVIRSKTFAASLPEDGAAAVQRMTAASATSNSVEAASLGEMDLERWYQTPFLLQRVSSLALEKWIDARLGDKPIESLLYLSLPAENTFVPSELASRIPNASTSLKKIRSDPPVAVVDETSSPFPRSRIYYSKDEAFQQPRFVIHALVHSCGQNVAGYGNHPILSLASSVFGQLEARRFYLPSVAGLQHSVSVGSRGLGLSVSGYSPRLLKYLEVVAQRFGSVEYWKTVDENTVEICKERMLRSMRSWVFDRPDSVADTMLNYLLQEEARLPSERIALAETMNKSSLIRAMQGVLRRSRVSVYVHGDSGDKSTAQKAAETVSSLLGEDMPLDEVERHQLDNGWGIKDRVIRARVLRPGHTEVMLDTFNPDDTNSALLMHFQTATRSPKTSAMSILLTSFLREPFFNELRTRRQMGYIVQTAASGYGSQHFSMRGITLRILSQRYNPQEMQTAVEDFLFGQEPKFSSMTQEDVENRASSVIKSLLDPPTSYGEEASQFWTAIIEDTPFNWVDQVIDELKMISVQQIQEAFAKYLKRGSVERRSVAILIESAVHKKQKSEGSDGTDEETCNKVNSLTQLTEFRNSLAFIDAEKKE